MGNRFASAQKALGICDVCGFQYPLRRLRSLIVKNRDTNVKACPECWEPDHPQLRLGEFPVDQTKRPRQAPAGQGFSARSRRGGRSVPCPGGRGGGLHCCEPGLD